MGRRETHDTSVEDGGTTAGGGVAAEAGQGVVQGVYRTGQQSDDRDLPEDGRNIGRTGG